MPIQREYIYIQWYCINGHSNSIHYRYDDYEGTVREVVYSFITCPTMISDHPCTICRERGFHNVSWEFETDTPMDMSE